MADIGYAAQEVGTVGRRERNTVRKRRIVAESDRRRETSLPSIRGAEIGATRSKRSREVERVLSLKPRTPLAPIARTCSTREAKISSLSGGGRENWLRIVRRLPARSSGRGSAKMAKRVHAVPPMKTAPTQAKTSRQRATARRSATGRGPHDSQQTLPEQRTPPR